MEVEYKSIGSGEALESWGVGGHAANFGTTDAFTGTDQPANETQGEEEEKNANGGLAEGKGTLRTIPVLQAAVAVIVHLPEGCKATSTAAPGRLALKNSTLEKIFEGKDHEWGKVFKVTEGGDTITCTTKTAKELKAAPLTRVVRSDGSGTTAIFKKYLNLIDKKEIAGFGKTWEQSAEEVPNTNWPNNTGVTKVIGGLKGPGVVAEVVKNAGTIGYANLADARANAKMIPPEGGAGQSTFWVKVEDGSKPSVTFADPATNEDEKELAQANCKEEVYTNGKKKFPPPTTAQFWNQVTTSKVEKNYTICGFSYDQALTAYGDYSTDGGSEEEARSVFDYLNYALDTGPEGGQTQLAEKHDYLGLPESGTQDVLKIAKEGAAEID